MRARKKLQNRIRKEGVVKGNYLQVTKFLNHQVDPVIIEVVGKRLAERFEDRNATKVVTAEAAGNTIGYKVAEELNVKLVYAKKGPVSETLDEDKVTQTKIESPTKGNKTNLYLSTKVVKEKDRFLLIDDFLFTGTTATAITELIEGEGASVVGYGFAICKRGAQGYRKLLKTEIPLFSIVDIKKLGQQQVRFLNPNSS